MNNFLSLNLLREDETPIPGLDLFFRYAILSFSYRHMFLKASEIDNEQLEVLKYLYYADEIKNDMLNAIDFRSYIIDILKTLSDDEKIRDFENYELKHDSFYFYDYKKEIPLDRLDRFVFPYIYIGNFVTTIDQIASGIFDDLKINTEARFTPLKMGPHSGGVNRCK